METYELFIGGKWQQGQEKLTVKNPFNQEPVREIFLASVKDVDDAVKAATQGEKEWSSLSQSRKGEYLFELARKIENRVKELAELETRECGRPVKETKNDIESVVNLFRYYGGLADKIEGKTIPVEGNRFSYTLREPLGVTAHITPWNFPLKLAVRSIAPSLVAGNTVVLKPPVEAPLTCLELAKEVKEVGFPNGSINVIPGRGSEAGERLINHESVGGVSFIGSRETGKHISETAGRKIVPSTMELGGKSPQIVFPDADREKALEGVLGGIFRASGQSCNAGSRLFVHEKIHDSFVGELVELTEELKLGDGLKEDTDLGPLINQQQFEKVRKLVNQGVENGAQILTGGHKPEDNRLKEGYFYIPTLITDVPKGSPLDQKEIFGPVLVIHEFADKREVIQEANNVKYGLYGGIWTENLELAHEVAGAIKAGGISVNEYPSVFPQLPFGGFKKSGIGREQGIEAIDNFLRTKSVTINLERQEG